jgi:hypothetical protein
MGGRARTPCPSVAALAAFMVATVVAAEEARPANTLMDMRHQFGACMSGRPIGPSGSALTIVLMMKRDGSIFGKPRITFSRLEGDDEARQRFLDDAERAIDSCVPFRVTPALGGAIAGRLFSVTLGGRNGDSRI